MRTGVTTDRWTCPDPDCNQTTVVAPSIRTAAAALACIRTAQRVHAERHAAERSRLVKVGAR